MKLKKSDNKNKTFQTGSGTNNCYCYSTELTERNEDIWQYCAANIFIFQDYMN